MCLGSSKGFGWRMSRPWQQTMDSVVGTDGEVRQQQRQMGKEMMEERGSGNEKMEQRKEGKTPGRNGGRSVVRRMEKDHRLWKRKSSASLDEAL